MFPMNVETNHNLVYVKFIAIFWKYLGNIPREMNLEIFSRLSENFAYPSLLKARNIIAPAQATFLCTRRHARACVCTFVQNTHAH